MISIDGTPVEFEYIWTDISGLVDAIRTARINSFQLDKMVYIRLAKESHNQNDGQNNGSDMLNKEIVFKLTVS